MSPTPVKNDKVELIERPPIVVVMGHIDHGKSTLLDYIRKSNIVEKEAGGITQHTGAYEVFHKGQHGKEKRITFLDTPGHEAFTLMRSRGATAADIAILMIAADDGVKAQTREALRLIKESNTPYIVAINKIDKPNVNVEKIKQSLAEHEVFVEGYGGDVPLVEISAKTGQGVDELLDLLLLVAELEELKGNPNKAAEGVIIESHRNPQKGISATLIIQDGVLKNGMYVVAEESFSPVRRMETLSKGVIREASFSSPVQIIGFNSVPHAGASFVSYATRKEAEKYVKKHKPKEDGVRVPAAKEGKETSEEVSEKVERVSVPLVIKADARGTLEAIEGEINKLSVEQVDIKVLSVGVGDISESDIKRTSGGKKPIILGFNVVVDSAAKTLAEQLQIQIQTFDIIYKLTEWLEEELKKRKPKIRVEETAGKAKIIRVFSTTKNKQVVGGKVTEGKLVSGGNVKIFRRESEIERGKILELQQQKLKTKEVAEGLEFGAMIEAGHNIAEGDIIEVFVVTEK